MTSLYSVDVGGMVVTPIHIVGREQVRVEINTCGQSAVDIAGGTYSSRSLYILTWHRGVIEAIVGMGAAELPVIVHREWQMCSNRLRNPWNIV